MSKQNAYINSWAITVLTVLILSFNALFVQASDSNSVSIRWKPPKQFSNGKILIPRRDLKQYRIYYGPSRKEIRKFSITISANKNYLPLNRLDQKAIEKMTIVYLAVTAIGISSQESDLSEITFFLP